MQLTGYMNKALQLARQAAAAGEVPVGALIVKDGEIIVCAYNLTEARQSSLAHAEMLVIESAQSILQSRFLTDCTLFVTMEPCPMCAWAIVLARVGRVVYGCPDSRFGACGSAFNVPAYQNALFKPEVIGGICEAECAALLQEFFRMRRAETL